jgi:hypothetical protein
MVDFEGVVSYRVVTDWRTARLAPLYSDFAAANREALAECSARQVAVTVYHVGDAGAQWLCSYVPGPSGRPMVAQGVS